MTDTLATGQETETATETGALSTQPARPAKPLGSKLTELMRYWWRQLTSMRTALVLLFLLALAAVPGSLLPQRSLSQTNVAGYFQQHPDLAPVLDRLGFFDVFASPWFAAVYLLLFVSLGGCLVPRIRLHYKALRALPPAAPRRLDRLPESARGEVAADDETPVDELADRVEALLRKRRWRVVRREERDGAIAVAAEKGYLRETGNLLFHVSLVALLGGLAVGRLFGYEGSVIVEQGRGFCNTVQAYDTFRGGTLVSGSDMTPLCVDLNDFDTKYESDLTPAQYDAAISYNRDLGAPAQTYDLQVNSPLRVDGVRVYLTGHGYSPVFTVKLPSGRTYTDVSAPFLPTDQTTLASQGALKLPDTNEPGKQLALEGFLVPTAVDSGGGVLTSVDPRLNDPAVAIVAYQGLLGLDTGNPQSVYAIDERQLQLGVLERVGSANLGIDQTLTLDDGTEITFTGVKQWAALQVSRDPGQLTVLVAAGLVILGLVISLRVRRRRMWVRITPGGPAAAGAAPDDPSGPARRTVIEVGGLARTDSTAFGTEFAGIAGKIVPEAPARAWPAAGEAIKASPQTSQKG